MKIEVRDDIVAALEDMKCEEAPDFSGVIGGLLDLQEAMTRKHHEQKAQLKIAVEALDWYANERNYWSENNMQTPSNAKFDSGTRAREAIAKIRGEK